MKSPLAYTIMKCAVFLTTVLMLQRIRSHPH